MLHELELVDIFDCSESFVYIFLFLGTLCTLFIFGGYLLIILRLRNMNWDDLDWSICLVFLYIRNSLTFRISEQTKALVLHRLFIHRLDGGHGAAKGGASRLPVFGTDENPEKKAFQTEGDDILAAADIVRRSAGQVRGCRPVLEVFNQGRVIFSTLSQVLYLRHAEVD